MNRIGSVKVAAISSDMFHGKTVNPQLSAALADEDIRLSWDDKVISADTIVLHNPSFLKFNKSLASRLVCTRLIVVTHENFYAPDGSATFDATHCLELIDDAVLCRHKILAPVSDYNREGVSRWCAETATDWMLAEKNWFNICDFEVKPPTKTPRDRRGRHSRAGYEKFPGRDAMMALYPAHAERVALLGADTWIDDEPPHHWHLYKFREMAVDAFLKEIDFFVYFTNPNWRESFGRAIVEAVAAGKLVITDPATAANIGPGLIGCTPEEVDGHIAGFIANPDTYAATVRLAQRTLARYSPDAFATMARDILAPSGDTR